MGLSEGESVLGPATRDKLTQEQKKFNGLKYLAVGLLPVFGCLRRAVFLECSRCQRYIPDMICPIAGVELRPTYS